MTAYIIEWREPWAESWGTGPGFSSLDAVEAFLANPANRNPDLIYDIIIMPLDDPSVDTDCIEWSKINNLMPRAKAS